MKLTNPKNGEPIDSPFTNHAEAAQALMTKLDDGVFRNPNFAESLLGVWNRPSKAQAFWIHKLAMPLPPLVAQESSAQVEVSRIVQMFDSASSHLKRPKIILGDVKFYIAGPRSRYEGQIMIVSKEYGGAYYGRIDNEGKLYDGRDMDDELRDKIISLAENPEAVASENGKLTGNCCFCGRKLTDPRSVSVGYGPVCAERYGLEWGTVAEKAEA